MALQGVWAVLYYGILASITGGWLPVRAKNCWLTAFHIYLILMFVFFPLAVALVSSITRVAPNMYTDKYNEYYTCVRRWLVHTFCVSGCGLHLICITR